jgi:hypothetical protein
MAALVQRRSERFELYVVHEILTSGGLFWMTSLQAASLFRHPHTCRNLEQRVARSGARAAAPHFGKDRNRAIEGA